MMFPAPNLRVSASPGPGAQLGGGQLRRHGLHPSAAAEGPDAAADGGRGLGAPVAPGPGAQRLGALDGPGGWMRLV